MRYNAIVDEPPDAGGILKTDFKQALKFLRIVEAEELEEETKAELILRVFFDRMPDPPTLAWGIIERHLKGPEDKEEASEKTFDFNVDHGRIFASFLQAYGLDLRRESMHWWQFLELVKGLPKDTALMETIELRGREIPKKGDAKYIRQLRRAKRAVALDGEFNDKKAAALKNMMFGE